MARYQVLRNSSLEIQLESDYQDNGWSLVGGNAVHDSINEGWIRNVVFKSEVGELYRISFIVSGLSVGALKISFGGVVEDITANGTYVREFTAVDTSGLSFWSNANVVILPVSIYKGKKEYNTLLYNPLGVMDTYISYTCDHMVSLLGSYYTFKDGSLWIHNSNPVRNSFYGEVHKSIIKFAFNPEPAIIKNLKNVKINGNKCWDLMDISVQPYDGKPGGQLSRLKKNMFESLQGDFHAVFLKDMNDPRFQNKLQALFEGADLQGKIVEITMEVEGGDEVRLVNVDFMYTNSNYTY